MAVKLSASHVSPADLQPLDPSGPIVDDHDGPELLDPTTGELIALSDIDGLIDAYERIDKADRACYKAKLAIREAIFGHSEGTAKTRRVRGKRRQVKLTMPSETWDQSMLREGYFAYPQFRDEFLRIVQLAPKMREYKKLVNTSGRPELETFRNILTKAERPPSGTPTLAIET